MLEKRAFHGTCCIDGTFLYVFCGRQSHGLMLRIEKLKLFDSSEVWQAVNLEDNNLAPVYGNNAVQMNKHEIVLLGGYNALFPSSPI